MTERSERDRTRDIFAHIREILERDGDKAEILFNAIQLRMLLTCEPNNLPHIHSGPHTLERLFVDGVEQPNEYIIPVDGGFGKRR